jgi:hypothetical protein
MLREAEKNINNLSAAQRENAWNTFAYNALMDGKGDVLGFALKRLQDWSRIAPHLADLFLGDAPVFRVEFKRKSGRGRPADPMAMHERARRADEIERAEGRNLKERMFNAGVKTRTGFRARAVKNFGPKKKPRQK